MVTASVRKLIKNHLLLNQKTYLKSSIFLDSLTFFTKSCMFYFQKLCCVVAFGTNLLSYINFFRLFPLEDQLRYSMNEEHAGWLEKDKGESLANAAVQFFSSRDRRWFVARYGFLAYFKVSFFNLFSFLQLFFLGDFFFWSPWTWNLLFF